MYMPLIYLNSLKWLQLSNEMECFSYKGGYGIHGCTHCDRNKDQKLVNHFYEDRIFYRLLSAVLLKMYRKHARL